MKTLLLPILLVTAGVSAVQAAVVFPYTTTFATANEEVAAGYYKSNAAQWSAAGTGNYTNTVSANAAFTSASSVQVQGRGVTDSFQVQTTFVYTAGANLNSYTFGLAALGTGDAVTGASASVNFYLADISNSGGLRIGQFAGTTFTPATVTTSGTALGNLVVGNTYTLNLVGSYSGSALTLSLTAIGNSRTQTATISTAYATPLAGEYFGYRNRVNTGTANPSSYTVDYQDFSVTGIPEPASLALLALGGLGLTARRRR